MSKLENNFSDAGSAIWTHRQLLRSVRPRLEDLACSIGRLSDSGLSQYAQLFAICMQFKPTLILEVGRAWGNSTAVFTEAANHLPDTRVVSICLTDIWQTYIQNRVAQLVEPGWFAKLEVLTQDFLETPLNRIIKPRDSVLFFWDAHGWNIGEFVLSHVLPKLAKHPHQVLVHDIMDIRHHPHLKKYPAMGVWNGYSDTDNTSLIINSMSAPFEEVLLINDFAERNGITIRSVEHEVRTKIFSSKYRAAQISKLLGNDLASPTSSIHYFTLDQKPARTDMFYPAYHYPRTFAIKFTPRLHGRGTPLVSIVTPCFNSAKFLTGCIESVLAQDYPLIEHIIQDGNSTDGTRNILKQYAHKKYCGRIKVVSETDSGQSDGLNRALKRVKGEIFLVLNADDELLPNACSWGVEQMRNNPEYAMVYGDEYITDENGDIVDVYIGKYPYLYERLFCVELVPPAQAAFIRKSMMEEVGLSAQVSLSTCPDFEMWVRLGAKYPFKHEFGIVCKYRHHQGSEGSQPDMVDKMVDSKHSVINRVLSDPATPKKIKRLKKRAYAGLYHWGFNIASSTGAYRSALQYLWKSFLLRPKLYKTIQLVRFTSHHVPNYLKNMAIKTLLRR